MSNLIQRHWWNTSKRIFLLNSHQATKNSLKSQTFSPFISPSKLIEHVIEASNNKLETNNQLIHLIKKLWRFSCSQKKTFRLEIIFSKLRSTYHKIYWLLQDTKEGKKKKHRPIINVTQIYSTRISCLLQIISLISFVWLKASIEGLRRRQPIQNIHKKAFEFNYELRERLKQ